MQIAKITESGVEVGQAQVLFPDTSFPSSGPNSEFMAEHNCLHVATEKPHDSKTQRLVAVTPYVEGGKVFTVEVVYKTAEELAADDKALQDRIVEATQQRLDDFARTRNYDGILSACTYATSAVPKFAAEGQVAVNLRDATWAALYQILEEVQAGQREAPTGFSDIEPLLPPLEWPV